MKLNSFPKEVLRCIFDGSNSFLVIELWKCGDVLLNTKLSQGGVTDVRISAKRELDSRSRWPRMLKELEQLSSLSVLCSPEESPGSYEMIRSELRKLGDKLKKLEINHRKMVAAWWVDFEYPEDSSSEAESPDSSLEEMVDAMLTKKFKLEKPQPTEEEEEELEDLMEEWMHGTLCPRMQEFRNLDLSLSSMRRSMFPRSLTSLTLRELDLPDSSLASIRGKLLPNLRYLKVGDRCEELLPTTLSIDAFPHSSHPLLSIPPSVTELSLATLGWDVNELSNSFSVSWPSNVTSLSLALGNKTFWSSLHILPRNLTKLRVERNNTTGIDEQAVSRLKASGARMLKTIDREAWSDIITASNNRYGAGPYLPSCPANLKAIEEGQHFGLPLSLKEVHIGWPLASSGERGSVMPLVLPPRVTIASLGTLVWNINPALSTLPPLLTSLNWTTERLLGLWCNDAKVQMAPNLVSLTIEGVLLEDQNKLEWPPNLLHLTFNPMLTDISSGFLSSLPPYLKTFSTKGRLSVGTMVLQYLPRSLTKAVLRNIDVYPMDFPNMPPHIWWFQCREIFDPNSAQLASLPKSLQILHARVKREIPSPYSLYQGLARTETTLYELSLCRHLFSPTTPLSFDEVLSTMKHAQSSRERNQFADIHKDTRKKYPISSSRKLRPRRK